MAFLYIDHSDLQTHPKKPLPRETNASEVYADEKEKDDSDAERKELLQPPKKPLPKGEVEQEKDEDEDEEDDLPAPPSVNDDEDDGGSELRSLPPVESDSE